MGSRASYDAFIREIGVAAPSHEESAQFLARSGDVYEALSKHYQVCNTVVDLFGPPAERAASCAVQAARTAARDGVLELGVRSPAVLPLLEELRAALAAPAAKGEDEAARVAADIAFLRGDPGAESEGDTWLAALLYSCAYLAVNHRPSAQGMLPRIAAVSGRAAAELVFDSGERRWTVREPGTGALIAAPPPAALRCARPGCVQRGVKVCAACRAVRYCGLECSAAHWKLKPGGHKAACKAAQRAT